MSDTKKEDENEEEEEEEDDSVDEKKTTDNKINNNTNNTNNNKENISKQEEENNKSNKNTNTNTNNNKEKSNLEKSENKSQKESKETKSEKEIKIENNILTEENQVELKESKSSEKQSQKDSSEKISQNQNIKILFDKNQINTYWKNQPPLKENRPYLDQLFPPVAESLYDKKMKNAGVEKVNIHQIDFRKSTEIFKKKDLTLFPSKNITTNEINFEINYKENDTELIHDYSHFFHAIKILTKIPGLIPQLFKTEKINPNGYYELYIYTNGHFKIIILDDYFPIIKGSNILRFSKPVKSEIWLLLMEKAFAKLNGGYGSLFSCNISHVIQAFTGFSVERLFFYDLLDIEDLEDIIRINTNINYINLCPKKNICEEIGIIPGRAYLVEEIFDVRNNDEEGKEECLKVIKIENLFECGKYKGDWSFNGNLFNNTVKDIVGFDPNDKSHIYMSIEFVFKYFEKVEIIYPNFDTNIKLIKISDSNNNNPNEENALNQPQIFNLYVPFKSQVSMS